MFSSSVFASGSTLTAVTGTLTDMKNMIDAGLNSVETAFEKNPPSSGPNGSCNATGNTINLVGGGTLSGNAANPYVSVFKMLPNFYVTLRLNQNDYAVTPGKSNVAGS